MDLLSTFCLVHLHSIIELLHYNDIFSSTANIFNSIVHGMRVVAPAADAICLVIGGYFWMFGGEAGKQTAKKWWIGTAVGIAVVFGAEAIVNWLQNNAKFN